MTYFRKSGWGLATFALLAVVFYACKKDSSTSTGPGANQQRLNVYFTDDPGYFDNVFLDIRSVQVLVDTCGGSDDQDWGNDYNRCHWGEDKKEKDDSCQVWDSLAVSPGVYDILSLRNGGDTLLGNGVVPAGKVKKIVITLGDNNYVVKDSVQYPLKAENGQVRLVISIRQKEWEEYQSGNYRLWLDFDVDRSVIQSRNGSFLLRPVIHVYAVSQTGTISGKVIPHEAYPVITLFNDTDTAYALPFNEGSYKIRGLNTGTYSLFVNASNGYADTTLTGITIERGKNTNVSQIKLHK